jgi:putative ABC transport system permease protein
MHFTTFVLKNLARRPVRTALTVLGLAVAVGSMIALPGISHNIDAAVLKSLDARGVDLVVTSAGKTDQLTSDLDESLADRTEKIPGVTGVSTALVELVELTRDSGSSINVMLHGWTPENFVFDDLKIRQGRKLTSADRGKVMLGSKLAYENLEKTVGDTVMILGESFEVVGVFESFFVHEDGSVAMPLREAQRLAGRPGKITGYSVRVQKSPTDPDGSIEAVRQQILTLTDDKGRPAKLSAKPAPEYVASVSHLKMVRAMAWLVSAIGMLIGVISMLNTMIMSVLERTQEIGILRAIGWPRSRVFRMILTEAVLISLAAAILGAIGATTTTYLLTLSPKVNGFIEGGIAWSVILEGTGLSVLIALVGGAYPAIRAARLLPTEAIRHE